MTDTTDILIIGAGPAGLFAGFYAGMRELTTRIIDSLPDLGGQPKVLYPKKDIYDIGGYPAITGDQLTKQLTQQLQRFKDTTTFQLNEEVLTYEQHNHVFKVTTNKNIYYAKTIIIATGNGSFHPRKIKLENDDIYQNNISYYFPNPSQLKNKTVAVCGGGDSALDTALGLAPYAKQIYLIHRRSRFRAHEYSVAQAKCKENIEWITPYIPKGVNGKADTITHLEIMHTKTKEYQLLPIDHLCMAYGFVSSLGELKKWPIDYDHSKINVTSKMETNISGIYAIGDIATYPGKAELIATGFGEAPIAVNSIKQYLNPKEHIKPIHSSHMF